MSRIQFNGKTLTMNNSSIIINPQPPVVSLGLGLLYNTYAINDVRLLSNTGWHVASTTDWDNLTTYLGTDAGGKLKETGTEYWDSPNTLATNSVGFNARGTGEKLYEYSFIKQKSWYLTSTTGDFFGANFRRAIEYNNGSVNVPFRGGSSVNGYPTRLVKDSTSLNNGETGTYTGNDGKTYDTICINDLEWLSENLVETKWRSGAWIKGWDGGVYTSIDGTTWSTLTEGALAVYNDDPSTYM